MSDHSYSNVETSCSQAPLAADVEVQMEVQGVVACLDCFALIPYLNGPGRYQCEYCGADWFVTHLVHRDAVVGLAVLHTDELEITLKSPWDAVLAKTLEERRLAVYESLREVARKSAVMLRQAAAQAAKDGEGYQTRLQFAKAAEELEFTLRSLKRLDREEAENA